MGAGRLVRSGSSTALRLETAGTLGVDLDHRTSRALFKTSWSIDQNHFYGFRPKPFDNFEAQKFQHLESESC